MPNKEEWCAIVALANKAHIKYGKLYDTENQFNIVMNWARKWSVLQEKNKERAKKWNKEHPERHNELNKLSLERRKNARNASNCRK